MKDYNIEISYQPINDMWGALIRKGNTVIFEVDADVLKAVERAIERYSK